MGNINLEFPEAPRVRGLKAFNAFDNSAAKSSLHVERCGLAHRIYLVSFPPVAIARNLQKFLSARRSVRKVNIVGRKLATWHTVLFLGIGTYPGRGRRYKRFMKLCGKKKKKIRWPWREMSENLPNSRTAYRISFMYRTFSLVKSSVLLTLLNLFNPHNIYII